MNPLLQSARADSPKRRYILRATCYLFFTFGALALGYAGFVFADAHTYQALEMKNFRQPGRLVEPHLLADGDLLGELQVPRLGLNAMVVQGNSPSLLRRAVGHLSQSALPGEWGNVALAGHRDTFFRSLRNIRVGDEIRFDTWERSFEYRVESMEVVSPTDVRVLETSTGHDLTLLTCFPFQFVGPSPKRFVVRAREVEGALREQLAFNSGASQ